MRQQAKAPKCILKMVGHRNKMSQDARLHLWAATPALNAWIFTCWSIRKINYLSEPLSNFLLFALECISNGHLNTFRNGLAAEGASVHIFSDTKFQIPDGKFLGYLLGLGDVWSESSLFRFPLIPQIFYASQGLSSKVLKHGKEFIERQYAFWGIYKE